jgi:hypothetical protein
VENPALRRSASWSRSCSNALGVVWNWRLSSSMTSFCSR